MTPIFSHLLAFSVLFIGAIWDLKTTEVPDILGIIGVLGGILLHGYIAFVSGSLQPLIWSLGAGAVLSLYGWGMYFLGMWGGADAFAMSVLGFAAPYGLSGSPEVLHVFNLLVNVMIAGFIYSIGFAVYKAFTSGGVFKGTVSRLKEEESRIAVEILLAAAVSSLAVFFGLNGLLYFSALVLMIFLYRFLQVLESKAMSFDRDVSDLEPGDVICVEDVDIDIIREKTLPGRFVEVLASTLERVGVDYLSGKARNLEERVGYPEIVGIKEEELEKLESSGIDSVKVKTGTRFVPVFPVALLITDVFGGGIFWLIGLVSL